MANFSEFEKNKNVKNILGSNVDIDIHSTFNLYSRKRKIGALNIGKTIDESGVEHTVYLLGEDNPHTHFSGYVIALAKLKDSDEDEIWIAVPGGVIMYEPKITGLLKKYLPVQKYSFMCFYEKSCGAVMYTYDEGERKYILITNISGHIGFPKGHIEDRENEIQTAKREIYEETGIKAELIDGFRFSYNYFINGFIRKKAVYYLSSFKKQDIKMNIREISEYRLLNFSDALELLNFRHDKELLEKADRFIDEMEGKQ